MNKRRDLLPETALLTAIAALLGLTLSAAAPSPCEGDPVQVAGWLIADDVDPKEVLVVVEVDGRYCQPARVTAGGRFHVDLPGGAVAKLHFQHQGHLDKEVVIDTRNVGCDPQARYKARRIKFGVVLEPEHHKPGRRFDGPVGSIAYTKGGGTMKVRHHERLVAREGQAPRD